MMVWPFNSKDKKGDLELDPDAQNYYDEVSINVKEEECSQNKSLEAAKLTNKSVTLTVPNFTTATDRHRAKPLKQVAMDNCVEFENAYSKCLVHGSYFERIASCQPQSTMYEQCKNMQIEALEMLGYAQSQDDAQRKSIKMLADDSMIKAAPSLTITESQVDIFHRLVQEAAKNLH